MKEKKEIFELFKSNTDLTSFENLENYFENIFHIYKENTVNDFETIMTNFLSKFNKAYILCYKEKVYHYTDYQIDDILFLKIIKQTNWENTTKIENFRFEIVDINEVYDVDNKKEYDLYLLEDYNLFYTLFSFFTSNKF
jgi:hypothetical protein